MSTPATPPSTDDIQAILTAEAERVSTVKLKLLLHVPFWASMLMQTRVVPNLNLTTYGATDGVDVIYYNPLLTRTLSLKQLVFLLLHEIGHIAFDHLSRQMGRHHQRWNYATDYCVNLLALDVKTEHLNGRPVPVCEFIPGGLLNEDFRGKSSETIYDLIETPPDESGGCDGGPGNFGGGIDTHLPSPTDGDVQERILEKILKAHAQWEAAGQRGHIPDGVLRRITELRASAIPWQRILRHWAVQCLGHDDYSYAPPHRRRLIRDELCYPSLHSEQTGALVVMVDTSGSVPVEALQQALSELPILADLSDDLLFLSHDAAVQDVIPTQRIGQFVRDLKTGTSGAHGNGGTSHIPAFEWLTEHKKHPALCLAFTDLDSTFPATPPPYPVLWFVWPKDAGKPVPFGTVVVIHHAPTS